MADSSEEDKSNTILDSEILELKIDIEEFVKETEKINKDFIESVNNINLEFRSVDSIFSKHHRQKKLYFDLKSQLNELLNENRNENRNENIKELSNMNESLNEIKLIVDKLSKSRRKTGSYFVSLIMGKVSVRIWNKGDHHKFKSEYNHFKERMMLIFFIFPAIQILNPYGFSVFINQLQVLFFFFYYLSLSIRENILSLNGSRIEPWWIYHHYWSILISILQLIIGEGISRNGIVYINYFFFYQGIVMLLQNDYQKKRHYARKALAQKSQIDIRTTEVIDETPHSKYKILIPALYITYAAQLIISIYFLFLSSSKRLSQLQSTQIILMSICWFILSIGNTNTLSKVLKKKKLHSKSKKLK